MTHLHEDRQQQSITGIPWLKQEKVPASALKKKIKKREKNSWHDVDTKSAQSLLTTLEA